MIEVNKTFTLYPNVDPTGVPESVGRPAGAVSRCVGDVSRLGYLCRERHTLGL